MRAIAWRRLVGQEAQSDAVGAALGQVEVDHGAQKRVGDLDQDARAIARVGFGALRAAMVQVAQRPEGGLDDGAAGPSLDVDHEGHAAGIVLEARVVQPRLVREAAER